MATKKRKPPVKKAKAHRGSKAPKGWKCNEFGELVRKPVKWELPGIPAETQAQARKDIIDLVTQKATHDIQSQEDRNTFRTLDRGLLTEAQQLFVGAVQARIRRFKQNLLASLLKLDEEIEDALIQHLKPVPEKPKKTVKRKPKKPTKRKR
jgi:hypothetical protein